MSRPIYSGAELIPQPFHHFTYVTTHSPTFPSLHLRHSSFSIPSVALPTSQFILQPFHCFTYVTAHSPALLSLLLHHRLFTYVTWRAGHAHHRYIVPNMCSNPSICPYSFPQAYKVTPFKWWKLFNMSRLCTLRRGIIVPYSEGWKHCSPLKAPLLLSTQRTQRLSAI